MIVMIPQLILFGTYHSKSAWKPLLGSTLARPMSHFPGRRARDISVDQPGSILRVNSSGWLNLWNIIQLWNISSCNEYKKHPISLANMIKWSNSFKFLFFIGKMLTLNHVSTMGFRGKCWWPIFPGPVAPPPPPPGDGPTSETSPPPPPPARRGGPQVLQRGDGDFAADFTWFMDIYGDYWWLRYLWWLLLDCIAIFWGWSRIPFRDLCSH